MRLSVRLRMLAVATLGIILLVGVVTMFQVNANGPIIGVSDNQDVASVTPTVAPPTPKSAVVAPATARVQPVATRPAKPTATPRPRVPVTLSLTSVEPQPEQGGLIVTIDIANNSAAPLNFQFAPEYDLQVTDSHGHDWPLRWAAYAGAPSIPGHKDAQLVRAFVAVDASHAQWPLTVTVRHVPAIGQVTWHVDKNGAPSLDSAIAPIALPTVPASGPVSLKLANVQPSSQLGGVQADLIVSNNQANELVFSFDPNSQVSAQDSLGRPYNVRWAQYGGIVHVAPHQTVRLARVFLAGPLDNGNPTWIKVSVKQIPGAKPLQAAAAI